VFENGAEGKFRLKREEVAGGWRRLHNEELHNLYASPNVVMVIKLRGLRWAGHVAWMGDRFIQCLWKRPLRRPRNRWKIVFRWSLGKWVGSCGMDSFGSG
jgi:hypothetical protein